MLSSGQLIMGALEANLLSCSDKSGKVCRSWESLHVETFCFISDGKPWRVSFLLKSLTFPFLFVSMHGVVLRECGG